MHRVLFELPSVGIKLHSFGVFLLLACVSALWITVWRAGKEGLKRESVIDLAIWLMGGGFIGARLLFILAHPETVHSLSDVVRIWQGGIVYYGCILGGLIGSLIYWRRNPFPFRAMADAVAPALALGSALGRVGCYLNGCCFGARWEGPWSTAFPAGSLPWARQVSLDLIPINADYAMPVHPAQIYAALDGLIILALLTAYFPLRRRDGEVMALLMVTYPVTRFLIEGLRDDEPQLSLGLTMSQWISVALLGLGVATWVYLARQPRVRHVDQPAPRPRAKPATPRPAHAAREFSRG